MIYLKDKQIIPFKGNFKPMGVYVGDKAIFEPIEDVSQGENIQILNTYNDELKLKLHGSSFQEQKRIAHKKDTILQFADGEDGSEGIVCVRANNNLLRGSGEEFSWKNKITYYYELIPITITEPRPFKVSYDVKVSTLKAIDNIHSFRSYFRNDEGPLGSIKYFGDLSNITTEYTRITFENLYVENVEEVISLAFGVVGKEDWNDTDYVVIKNVKLEYADLPLKAPTIWIPHETEGTRDIEVEHCGRNLWDTQGKMYRQYGCTRTFDNNSVTFTQTAKNANFSYEIPTKNRQYTVSVGEVERVGGLFAPLWISSSPMQDSSNMGDLDKNSYKTFTSKNAYVYLQQYVAYTYTKGNYSRYENLMLELGDTVHPYEEYKGETLTLTVNEPKRFSLLDGVNTLYASEDTDVEVSYLKAKGALEESTDTLTPTPDFPVEINSSFENDGENVTVLSKNLIDINKIKYNYDRGLNCEVLNKTKIRFYGKSTVNYAATNQVLIQLEVGKTYSKSNSKNGDPLIFIIYFLENGIPKYWVSNSLTVTENMTDFSYYFQVNKAGTEIDTIIEPQIQEGISIDNIYTYHDPQIFTPPILRSIEVSSDYSNPTYMKDNKYYVADTLENGEYVQRIGKIVFDGTEGWSFDGKYVFSYSSGKGSMNTNNNYAYCNMAFPCPKSSVDNTRLCVFGSGNGYIEFNPLNIGLANSIDEWKSWIANQYAKNNPLIVYHILETPIKSTLPYNLRTLPLATQVITNSKILPLTETKMLKWE